jgi:TRAP-type C4-dicarboxylate transport system permease small subunit
MQRQGVWLGPMRQPIKLAMTVFVGCAVLTCAWLIFGTVFLGTGIGMRQMLRPEGLISVRLALWSILGAIVFSSLYLSDNVGAIETEPSGFMDWFSLICSRVAMIAIVVVVGVMFYEVVARYVFEKPTLWANEMSLWIAGFIYLLAGLYAMQQRSHIRIYIIYDFMPRWMQKLADCITVFLIWCFAVAIVWGGFNEALDKLMRMETFGTAWDPPLPATIKPAILLIVCIVALQALSNLIADWNKAPEHHSPADEIDEIEIANIRRTLEGK